MTQQLHDNTAASDRPARYLAWEALAAELATYNAELPNWAGQEGRYALIKGADVLGVFDTYSDALTAGYKACGLEQFMVKQIAAIATVATFSRNVRPAWHISA